MNCTIEELLTINLAKTFKNGEVGFTGLATGKAAATYITNIPLAAMEFARKTHAPDLSILLCGWMLNPDLKSLDKMPDAEFDSTLLDIPCEAQLTDYPSWSHRRGEISFAFGSGVQVDKYGNVNSAFIGTVDKPKVALVGPIFLPEHMSVFGREYLMIPHHQKRVFVEKVDHISGVGFPGGRKGREDLGFLGRGPELIYTPLCIFGFDKDGKIFVKSIHPGVTADEVRENTGFDLGDLSGVPFTEEPSLEELKLLREDIDPKGILLGQ